MRRLMLTTALTLLSTLPALAGDSALLLGNESYGRLGRVARAADIVQAQARLTRLGFAVSALQNGRAGNTADALTAFVGDANGSGRLLVVMSGHFVTDGTRTWLLTSDATDPALLTLGATAVSVESVLRVLAEAPGEALLVLGADSGADGPRGAFLHDGIGTLDIPQGVTVVSGEPRDVADFVTGPMLQPGADIAQLVAGNRRLSASGFLPHQFVFMPPDIVASTPPATDTRADDTMWDGAKSLDTADAYRNYLGRYPMGRHAAEAEAAITRIMAEPNRADRLAEEALGLTADQRRAIQRQLTLLDFNTRGIDGIFGPGTRRAIANWQQDNGFGQTSYLTADQLTRIEAQAARKAAELEAAAEQKRQEEARQDRAFWEETGAKGDEAGYRAYLSRYPDGNYADTATAALERIDAQKQQSAQHDEQVAWAQARQADTVEAYRNYLQLYPQGTFQADAQARIDALNQQSAGAATQEQAAADERALNLTPFVTRLVEARLTQLGLNPGPVDGRFDNATRRAIRRYQRARDLPVTGYLSEAMMVRLLADSLPISGR
ncbi:MAG: peptidoglycan-binding protein [Limimaricola sp.]|uniref:peptidoglycan-binding domain-containing protein n=1 Tax=Limimaricola sp. TaxID=2211665 RepID=UPI001D6BCC71|nr:peptidoglycan-binding protein [Limimaricola sp.]MBI1416941.1 peptidoglycan-binding protein [Limimaricola sp.]